MPDFWQFPTVSMGLGPMMAIFQARFVRYLEHRGIVPPSDRKVWAFLGDGEMDEPESMGALTMPVREKLDNLIFVINCNLQRLDGPVRGNGKIIQELEAAFLGAGWNVIKVLWGSRWDPLLERDQQGLLKRLMEECVDGEYQNFKSKGGAYTREHFFGKYPRAEGNGRQHVRRGDLAPESRRPRSAEGLCRLRRRGREQGRAHGDPGEDGQGLRPRQGGRRPRTSRISRKSSATRRSRRCATASTSRSPTRRSPACRSASRRPDSEEMKYLQERRAALGGYLPARHSIGAAAGGAAARSVQLAARGHRRIARSPPPWRWCAC